MAMNSILLLSMGKVLLVPISCSKCGRRPCARVPRKTLKDAFMSVLKWHPWRCTACGIRFYLRRKTDDEPKPIHESYGKTG